MRETHLPIVGQLINQGFMSTDDDPSHPIHIYICRGRDDPPRHPAAKLLFKFSALASPRECCGFPWDHITYPMIITWRRSSVRECSVRAILEAINRLAFTRFDLDFSQAPDVIPCSSYGAGCDPLLRQIRSATASTGDLDVYLELVSVHAFFATQCPRRPPSSTLTAMSRLRGVVARVSTVLTAISTLTSPVACQTSDAMTVDDSDPHIAYRGSWIPSPGSDPEMDSFMGTLTFSNISGSSATLSFIGKHVACNISTTGHKSHLFAFSNPLVPHSPAPPHPFIPCTPRLCCHGIWGIRTRDLRRPVRIQHR